MISETEKKVLDYYFAALCQDILPCAREIGDLMKEHENEVHVILSRYYYVHLFYGKTVCDAQNLIFPKWRPDQLLLMPGKGDR